MSDEKTPGEGNRTGAEFSNDQSKSIAAPDGPQAHQRRRLPLRREHEIREFDHDGIRVVAGIGWFSKGHLSEVFFHSVGKPGSTAEKLAQDLGVVVSIACQRGASVAEIKHSLCKLQNGKGAGVLGALLDLIEGE